MLKYLKISLITFFLMFSNCLSTENKIILKINNDIITTIDVLNEIKSLKFFNKNLKSTK
jgi:peptidyl-prolyl cis-trans isomerase SurA